MKVLLKIINFTMVNNTLFQRFTQSILIWISTNVLGSTIFWMTSEIGFKLYGIILLSLLFSGPVILLLIPTLYYLTRISERARRIIFTVTSVLILCLCVSAYFIWYVKDYPLTNNQIASLLMPYIFSAELCFFLIARKSIIAK